MKTLSTAFQSRLADETIQLATCWKITRRDSTVLGFTDYTSALTVESVVYSAVSGFLPSAIEAKAGVSVDNLDVVGMIDAGAITEEDILAGRYDHAEITIFHVLPDDVAAGTLHLQSGHIGEITVQGGRFTAEIRGLSQMLNTRIGELYTPLCRAKLGDGRCKKDLASFTHSVSVSSAASRQEFTVSSLVQPSGYFNGGKASFTSGANNGLAMEIKYHASTVLTLVLPMPYVIAASDNVTLVAGCDKRMNTCINTFDNAVNFRGEPHVPGFDKLMETAGTRSGS